MIKGISKQHVVNSKGIKYCHRRLCHEIDLDKLYKTFMVNTNAGIFTVCHFNALKALNLFSPIVKQEWNGANQLVLNKIIEKGMCVSIHKASYILHLLTISSIYTSWNSALCLFIIRTFSGYLQAWARLSL